MGTAPPSDKHHDSVAQLLLWPGRALYLGPLLPNTMHAHHALQLTFVLEGHLRVQSAGTNPHPVRVVVMLADEPHCLSGTAMTAQLYLDPDSVHGRAVTTALGGPDPRSGGPVAQSLPTLRRLWTQHMSLARWRSEIDRLCDRLTDESTTPTAPGVDARVARVVALAQATPSRNVTLAIAAADVGLSPDRLSHLFAATTGLPLRRYLLWLRLIDAVTTLADTGMVTSAAHQAGFSDSAHLTRTFRRMFGMPPSALIDHHVTVHVDAHGVIPARPNHATGP